MNKKILFVSILLPISVATPSWAQDLPTVEVNMQVLNKFRDGKNDYIQPEQSVEVAMRPPAPRYEAPVGYPTPPVGSYHPTPAPEAAQAEEASDGNVLGIPGSFSANMGITSDYIYRGVSQSREGPAIQGGVDYEHDNGAYIGLWASSIDFGDQNATAEFDYYAGYSTEVAPNLTADGGVLYYNYPSTKSNLNYDFVELYGGLEYVSDVAGQEVTTNLTLNYSPDFFAGSGAGYYTKLAASTPVGGGFTVDGSLGHQWVEDNAAYLLPDYYDWTLGVAYELEGFEVKAQYVDTSISSSACADGCDTKGVLTLSKSL